MLQDISGLGYLGLLVGTCGVLVLGLKCLAFGGHGSKIRFMVRRGKL